MALSLLLHSLTMRYLYIWQNNTRAGTADNSLYFLNLTPALYLPDTASK
jgi:hypothetical protein